jgi:hypothetical protein
VAATRKRRGRARKHRKLHRRTRRSALGGRAALRALGSSALALSGVAGNAAADGRTEAVYAELNTSRYSEDPIDKAKGLPGADTDRMSIDMQQLLVRGPMPFFERWDFGVELILESMSGATPWYQAPDAGGTPIQILSGATVEDKRRDVNLSASLYRENSRLGFGTGFSTEKDYSAMSFSFDGETHFNEKNTTVSGGMGLSLDEIDPVDQALFVERPGKEDKKTLTLFGGLSQLLDRRSVVQTSLTYRFGDGYLSDPYKRVFVLGGIFLPDSRPDSRHSLAWLTRYRRHVEELSGTFHIDYQYHFDTWEVNSHTVDIAFHKSLSEALSIVASLRWYSQSEADFYVSYFDTDPGRGEYSSDYRLSAFGAIGFGLSGEYRFRTRFTGNREWRVKMSWENYKSSGDFGSGGGDPSPGLVNWSVLSIGLAVRW